MPTSATRLAAAIKAKRIAKLGARIVQNADLDEDCSAIAEAVLEELLAFGVVEVNPLGLTTGPTGGPVIGVCTGSIT